MTQGSCLCGAVTYEVSGPYRWMVHCHCSMCRKHHGSLYATTVGVDLDKFRWLRGEQDIVHYRTSPTFDRPFCRHCGSVVPDVTAEFVVTPAGSLADDLDMKPRAHIFTASRSPMGRITDTLRQFDEFPPGFGSAIAAPARTVAPDVIQGSCLCGEVVFEIDEPPAKMVNCHCTRCRRSRSATHGTNMFVPFDKLRWTRGQEHVRTYRVADAYTFTTSFCDTCGSRLPAPFEKAGRYLVPAGSLDVALDLTPGAHVFVGSKAPWFEITDTLPQFEAMPERARFKEVFF
jgi:hypothetical protein